jgi:hypothetical protein
VSEQLDRIRELADELPDAGAKLLDEIEAYASRFVFYPSEHCRVAHVLWCAHAHAMHVWESTPRLAFLSPEPGSGKSRALEITANLVPRPVQGVGNTSAYLFRKAADPNGLPTILYDEIDSVFGSRPSEKTEEIRAFINAGHRRGATSGRCVMRGKTVEIEELPAYCAVALAGIGNLPDTILTRSVIVRMQKRAPNERVEPYRRRLHENEGHELRTRLAEWAPANIAAGIYPEMPQGVEDRAADVWEPLLAVADAAGGDWPRRARVAAVSLVSLAVAASGSLGLQLLEDLRTVFEGKDRLSTETILAELCKLEESCWAELRGKPLNARGLAGLLRPYGVSSKQIRLAKDGPTLKGYDRADLHNVFERYLIAPKAQASETSETTDTPAQVFTFKRHGDDGEWKDKSGNGL